jgi:hypothetical protein
VMRVYSTDLFNVTNGGGVHVCVCGVICACVCVGVMCACMCVYVV